jgi:hypothetical protein
VTTTTFPSIILPAFISTPSSKNFARVALRQPRCDFGNPEGEKLLVIDGHEVDISEWRGEADLLTNWGRNGRALPMRRGTLY